MEESSASGLKQERARRRRVALIRKSIFWTVFLWILISMGICICLLFKVYTLEAKLDYLLEHFTISGQLEDNASRMPAETEPGASIRLENPTENAREESKTISKAVSPEENLAQPGEEHKVYLTFDDGPSSNTAAILDILKKYGIKATFFVIGKEDEASKALYRRIAGEGHTLAMHSYSHQYSILYQSAESFEEDFSKLQDYLYEITGKECLFYRFPGGSSNHADNADMTAFISCLNERGITYFDWNVASGDAASKAYQPQELLENVMKDVVKYKTSVVLMHDSAAKMSTVQALEPMINALQGIGAELLPIDENTTVVQHIAAASVEH